MTEEDVNYCEALGLSKTYYENMGLKELNDIGSFEFLTLLKEFVEIIKDDAAFH